MSNWPDTITEADGRVLHRRTWGPADAQIVFVVVHGLGEHSGCYTDFGARMAERNMATLAYDQHGHGLSPGDRGDAPEFDTYLGDIASACRVAREDWPDAELIFLGHSLGGHFVLRYLLDNESDRDRNKPAGAIAINPMILPANPPTENQAFAAWLTGKLLPHVRLSLPMDADEELTRDPKAAAAIESDPLIHGRLALGVAGKLMTGGHELVEEATNLDTPLLMLLGGKDDICDRETSLKLVENAGDRAEQITFDPMLHCLLAEQDRQQVYDAIFGWLDANLLTGD